MDDCYLGGPCGGGRRGHGTDKAKVVVALSKTDQGIPLFAHMQVVKERPNCGRESKLPYLYSEDAAEAIFLAASMGRDGAEYPLGSGQALPLRQYV